MGTFTILGESELAHLADVFGLGALRSFRSIAAGTVNSNYALETAGGRFFVRVNEGKAEADVAWESRLVVELAARGVATPAPVVTPEGRPYAPLGDKWVSIFAWREGHHLGAENVTPPHAEALGAELARLHEVARALVIEPRTSIYDHAHLVGRYERHIAPSTDPHLARASEVLREELAAAAAAAPIRHAATHGIIHGDLFRDNVLWSGTTVSALLDFEQASAGSLVYDLAVCLNDWCWSEAGPGAPRFEQARAMLTGYQRVRPLTSADRAALGVELRASAARFTITRITDVYLARVTNPEKDFRAFLARCDAWRTSALRALTDLV